MTLPTTIKINGEKWNIVLERIEEAYGETRHGERVIALDDRLKGKKRDVILIHELIHACLGDESQYYLERNAEELLCHLLAPRLLDVLKQMGWHG